MGENHTLRSISCQCCNVTSRGSHDSQIFDMRGHMIKVEILLGTPLTTSQQIGIVQLQ
jgi:hypothetical protein